MSTVTFDGISKIFPSPEKGVGVVAVDSLDLTVDEGQLVTLLGPSGCGKTTILRMLAGFESPTTGRILLDGVDITQKPVNTRGIGMVFQSYALFPHLSVRENVAYGLRLAKIRKDDLTRRVHEVMDLMQIGEYATRSPNQLSGGQQQRVALARAVVTEPQVLLFDEPLSNLDAQLREQMRDDLRAIQQRLGITSLYVTHDQSEALAISDEVVVLKDGRVCQRDTAERIYMRPSSQFVARFMGKANILRGTLTAKGADVLTIEAGGLTFTGACDRVTSAQIGVGEEVLTVLRPEAIRFRAQGDGPFEISRAVFQGLYIEYHLTIATQAFTIVDYDYRNRGILRHGQRISIDSASTTAWVLPADQDVARQVLRQGVGPT